MKLVISILLMAPIFVACSKDPTCTIHEFGLFTYPTHEEIIRNEDVATGQYRITEGAVIFSNSTDAPATVGSAFGVVREFHHLPKGESVKLTIQHPPIASPSGQVKTESTVMVDNFYDSTIYGIDSSREAVAGKWVFEFSYQGDVLCTQSLTTHPPN